MNIHIHTQGCTANQADSETMAGILEQEGHKIVEDENKADLIILNTCTVKTPTEDKAFSLLEKWKREKKKVIVAGCIPQSDPAKLGAYSLVGTRQVHRIAEAVKETIRGHRVALLGMETSVRLNLPKIRKNPVIEIVPINAGCTGTCSFCKTKQARGNLFSYDQHAIIRQIETAVQEGIKEVWLTSQDTGAYGIELKTNLPQLLKHIVRIKGDFKVRIGMMNPDHVLRFLDDLLEIMQHEKMFKFLHIPVQSGNNRILKEMQRMYKKEGFIKIVKKARHVIPNITLATDVIAGFPGETEAEFMDTYTLLKELKMPVVNISKFYPRSGTKAAMMKKLDTKIVKQRSTKLVNLQKRIITNREWLGWTGDIIIDEIGRDCLIGRNEYYKQVLMKGKNLLGKKVRVSIVNATALDLRGVLQT
ncbi:MAG: tRNA (N(6)-L-threonylcarbamoyladenosine(37)-C(2))-methylthiotransferase [Nanoarchaeota archaeon]